MIKLPPIRFAQSIFSGGNRGFNISQLKIVRYERTRHWLFGPLDGVITFNGPPDTLDYLAGELMAADFQENQGRTFRAMVTDVRFRENGSETTRLFQRLATAVRAKYTAFAPDTTRNLIKNPSFQTDAVISGHTFEYWDDHEGGNGAAVVKLTSGNDDYLRLTAGSNEPPSDAYITQRVSVKPLTNYRLKMRCYGTGTYDGEYYIIGKYNEETIVARTGTGQTAAAWADVTVDFFTPADVDEIEIALISTSQSPSANVHFNHIALWQYDDIDAWTAYVLDDDAVRRYGRIEKTIETTVRTETAALNAAKRELAVYAKAHALPTRIPSKPIEETAELELALTGYMLTATFRESIASLTVATNELDPDAMGNEVGVTLADNRRAETATLTNLVLHVLQYGCDYLSRGYIDSNTMQSVLPEGNPWEILVAIAKLGDANNVPWIMEVENLKVNYRQIDTSPVAFITKRGIRADRNQAELFDPWELKPGVWRQLDKRNPAETYTYSWMESKQDVVVETVTVDMEGEVKPELLNYEYEITDPQQGFSHDRIRERK